MKKILISLVFSVVILIGTASKPLPERFHPQTTQTRNILIQNPREGQALQGVEVIEGKIRGEGFQSGKISFTYTGQENPTWFWIADLEPDQDGGSQTAFRVEWDTSQITDGDYDLRVKAGFAGETALTEQVLHLRIRNYTVIETSTPSLQNTPSGDATPTPGPQPDPVRNPAQPLPENPAAVDQSDFSRALSIGLMISLGLFAAGGLYAAGKRFWR